MEINKHIHACDGCGAAVQCCSLFCIPLEETDAGGDPLFVVRESRCDACVSRDLGGFPIRAKATMPAGGGAQ